MWFVLSSWFIKNEMRIARFLGAPISKFMSSKVETLHATLSTKWNFRWHDFSEAPLAIATEANELAPIAAGGEGIGKRTPAVVINNSMSNGHRVPCDAIGGLSRKAGKSAGQGEVCIF